MEHGKEGSSEGGKYGGMPTSRRAQQVRVKSVGTTLKEKGRY